MGSREVSIKKLHDGAVSVIIPVYNVFPYLGECLDSVLSQTFRDLEILVVDDGSTDGSGSMCDVYAKKDPRVKVIHKENGGLSSARNCALDQMQGNYVMFLDSDDWLEPEAVQVLHDVITKTGADITICRFMKNWQNGKEVSIGEETEIREFTGKQILEHYINERDFKDTVWNKIYRAELFSDIRFPEGRVYEDISTTYKLISMADKIVTIPDVLVNYRARKSSISRTRTIKVIIDRWIASTERYNALKSMEEQYEQVLADDCLAVASTMWRWYAGNPREERTSPEAMETLCSMQRFAQQHRTGILKSKKHSIYRKVMCRCVCHRDPVLMRSLYLANQVYRKLKNDIEYE